MPNPTPGQVAYEAYVAAAHHVVGDALMRWEDTNMRYRAIWEAAAQAVLAVSREARRGLTAWERCWLAQADLYQGWADSKREIWCYLLEKYGGDRELARAIYDRTPLPGCAGFRPRQGAAGAASEEDTP